MLYALIIKSKCINNSTNMSLLQIMQCSKENVVKQSIIIIVLTVLITHLSEPLEMRAIKSLKSFIYSGDVERYEYGDGLVKTRYSFTNTAVINPVHNAQMVLQDAIEILEIYRDSTVRFQPGSHNWLEYSSVNGEKVLKMVEAMASFYGNEMINGSVVVRLPYEFPYPYYSLKAPWYSGMAQGQVAIIALASYIWTGNEKYLEFARRVARVLDLTVEVGGVKNLSHGHVWFEEYASPLLRREDHSGVLNGNNYALDGLYWMTIVDQSNTRWYELLVDGLRELEFRIAEYSSLCWSYYDNKKTYSNLHYHELHIAQLELILSTYGPIANMNLVSVKEYLDRFKVCGYLPVGIVERIILARNNALLLMLAFNLVIAIVIVRVFSRKGRKMLLFHN